MKRATELLRVVVPPLAAGSIATGLCLLIIMWLGDGAHMLFAILIGFASALVVHLWFTARNTAASLAVTLEEVRHSQLYIRKLEGILPTCMYCKRVRSDDDSRWVELSEYLRDKDVKESHGLCPSCEHKWDLSDA